MKNYIFILISLALSITGCSSSSTSDTYVRLSIEETDYEFNYVSFSAYKVNKENWRFIDLGQDPLNTNTVPAVPLGRIQWKMILNNIDELSGRGFDLRNVNERKLMPNVQFTLTKDLSVHADDDSTTILNITSIDGGYITGTFSGADWVYVSMTQDTSKRVNVMGSFHAELKTD